MTNTDLEIIKSELRRLVYENDSDTLIRNNSFIQARKGLIQLLYEELDYLTGSYFKDQDMGNWKTRFIEVAQEAEYIVDMFVSSAIINNDHHLQCEYPHKINYHLRYLERFPDKLKGVMENLKSIRAEFISNKMGNLLQNHVNRQDIMSDNMFNATGNTRVNLSTTEREEFIVGFEDDALLILDRLTGHRKKLDIISIVGMGGQGKTTLATKIFNDSLVKYHFHKRGWVTVSQSYSKQDLLLQLLASIGKSVDEATSEPKLRKMLYQTLKGKKYLIVIDDIWSFKAWDDVQLCFPDDNTGNRVLLTTRLTEVASHVSQGGSTHNLSHLTEDQSWELLCRKTFREYECPESLIETGKHIAKKCGGLPLALVVIGGLLEKGEKRKDLWEKIASNVGSYVINDPKGCMDTLALSYDHLPFHLKKCFLYAGAFPEDYKIQVRMLIRLWMAEGFIKESGERSLEEEGEYYLMDLIDRNLLIVTDKSSNGGIKSCRMHDLLRELCLTKASDENFFKKVSMPMLDNNSIYDFVSSMVWQRRLIFEDYEALCEMSFHGYATYTRSVICFRYSRMLENRTKSWVSSFLLVRVLDILNIPLFSLGEIELLIHLRYLAVWSCSSQSLFSWANESPFSKAKFGSLQTLIVKGKFQSFISPDNMLNLRHLRCKTIGFSTDSCVHRLLHLQTISRLRLNSRTLCLFESFPNIKKLGCSVSSASTNHGLLSFALLTHLEALNIDKYMSDSLTLANPIRYPENLKRLTLKGLHLPWNYMSTIQQLPNLEVLKLLDSSFKGYLWDTGEEQFHKLKYLKLENLNIHVWVACSINFPSLRKLVVKSCADLKEIPLELGDIYTLEHIEIDYANTSVLDSVNRIQEAQREIGNYGIHVNCTHMDPSEVYFDGDPFYD